MAWHLVDQKKWPPERPEPIKGFGAILFALLAAGAVVEYLRKRK